MLKKLYLLCLGTLVVNLAIKAQSLPTLMAALNKVKNTNQNAAPVFNQLSNYINTVGTKGQKLTINIPKGVYQIHTEGSITKEIYISNHDQENTKKVGLVLNGVKNITINANGSFFNFHGVMVAWVLQKCENVTLKNFAIDFEAPKNRQLTFKEINADSTVAIAELYPKGNYKVETGKLVITGNGFSFKPGFGMTYYANRHMVYREADVSFKNDKVEEIAPNQFKITGLKFLKKAHVGDVFALRTWERPCPAIVLDEDKNTSLQNIKVHYAEGMGLLAQASENIYLNKFSVCLKRKDDPRYYTTQADATHFSGCKGKIISENGLYENMADDAINVHGTYLKITKRIDDYTVEANYMHGQAWGFLWGNAGDSVQFIETKKMELTDANQNIIKSIRPVGQDKISGAKSFTIIFQKPLPANLTADGNYAVENLTWTPSVVFKNNLVKNNRARGALFSTPKKVVCENNVFDHVHGTGILLCGDANGWYETGACKDVTIKNNTFINNLTAYYQFTNAIISIYPEIPNLKEQTKYFHSGIVIENNKFITFDKPILYAKSTDGLVFRNNSITNNKDFKPFHNNKYAFHLQRVKNIKIENNTWQNGFDVNKDILLELSDKAEVYIK